MDVEIGGRLWTIPPLPAADWWPVLAGDESMLGLLPAGSDLEDLLIDGKVGHSDLESAFHDALEEASGRTAEEAGVIAGMALGMWTWVGGKLSLAGFRWDVMPLGAALDAIHVVLMENLNEEGVKRYEQLLKQAAPKQIDRAAALSSFEEIAGPRPSPAPLRSSAAPSGDPPARTRQPSQPPRRRVPSGAPTTPPA